MTLTYKVRLEPNNKQVGKFRQFAGAARFAYNWALEQQNKNHEASGKFLTGYDLRKQFTQYKQANKTFRETKETKTKTNIKKIRKE